LYALRETHWLPKGLALAADAAAERARRFVPPEPSSRFEVRPARVRIKSDLLPMLGLLDDGSVFPVESTTADVVFENGKPASPGAGGPVLLLGDSYSAVFADESAGLQAQIASRLGLPVEAIVRAGVGPNDLRDELSRRPEVLRGKTVVVWEMATRLLLHKWLRVPLPPP
jgi:hypothetical protein